MLVSRYHTKLLFSPCKRCPCPCSDAVHSPSSLPLVCAGCAGPLGAGAVRGPGGGREGGGRGGGGGGGGGGGYHGGGGGVGARDPRAYITPDHTQIGITDDRAPSKSKPVRLRWSNDHSGSVSSRARFPLLGCQILVGLGGVILRTEFWGTVYYRTAVGNLKIVLEIYCVAVGLEFEGLGFTGVYSPAGPGRQIQSTHHHIPNQRPETGTPIMWVVVKIRVPFWVP